MLNDLAAQRGWTLDHVAHAVRNIDDALKVYQGIFGLAVELRESSAEHLIDAAFVSAGSATIELIAPLEGNASLFRFLEKRGEGLHHICFRVRDLSSELSELDSCGVELIDRVPRKGLRNKSIAFIHPRSTGGALIELCAPAPGRER